MASAPRREVLVVGGGIGGLAAALALARRGAWVRVVEQAPAISEVGAGLQITPNGSRVLRALGLSPESVGVRALAVEPRDALTGRPIARFDLRRAGGDYFFVHRADLIDLLRQGAEAAGVPLRTEARVTAITPHGVELDGGEHLSADLVVGADGLHSVVRRHLLGDDRPFFTGQVAWRAIVPVEQGPVARIWMAPGKHVVTYPLKDGRLNVVAVREEAQWAEEGWSHRDSPDALRRAFGDVALNLKAILARVTEVGRWGLFRHPVADRWHDGRTVLLGDAAHPTLPFLAQGANLALEDAWVLAREILRDDLREGLDRYQAERRPRVSDAVGEANANARNYHLKGARRRAAHAGLWTLGFLAPGAFLRRYDWLYRFDVTADG
ncbi:Salicylate hydroxylase [Rubellimicrobium mesophilum DSM 19309]|uniref:Salicylate hydroxylase n=1 Tax=Rubellimicrobium mesophilum DSM 19309 TaxID=442562 RepID=A0A017HJY9_9RHOB|nr:FAD-dependent monooxygenase [Rubellimicrobium mesophilum]EYD74473.1 Salicylate hydroxylase [Rubellimicrobium mesophilum DSM 19309]